MFRLVARVVCVSLVGSVLWVAGAAAATEGPGAPAAFRILGPLPVPNVKPVADGPMTPVYSPVSEIDPVTGGPWAGQEVQLVPGLVQRWEDVDLSGGEIQLDSGGVYWVASILGIDRFSNVSIELGGVSDATVFVDGRALPGGDEGVPHTAPLHRGDHSLLIRLRVDDGTSIQFHAVARPAANVTWDVDRVKTPASYQQARQLVTIDSLAVNWTGTRIARRLRRRCATGDDTTSEVGIFDHQGRTVVASIGEGHLKPVAFAPDGSSLLLKRKVEELSDLVIYQESTGGLRSVVRDEPNLGVVEWHPGGSHVLLASSRGVVEPDADENAAYRRSALREKVTDYTTGPHLHLVEIESGARRTLTTPGDWVLDDATFSPDGRMVVYARTVPRKDYPWFSTEIRALVLASGEDRLITTVVAGWESRPKALAVSPEGRRVAFTGPPEEVVEGREGHNLLHSVVYVVDLASGAVEKISGDQSYAFTLRRSDVLAWASDGRRLVAAVTDRTSAGLATITQGAHGWSVERIPDTNGDAARIVALSGDLGRAALVASNPERPERLYLLDTQKGTAVVLDDPNDTLRDEWRLAPVHDASFTGPGGERIEAWWYEPAANVDSAEIPLVVYYYGGGTPTMRRFVFDHQFLAANGYAVLVMTPRGALGGGLEFADSHVNDWGPRSSADVLAGIDEFLEDHPGIDEKNIGIYGGSYGGFLTAYLLTVTDRFAAAVDMYGISNLASYWGAGVWGYTYGDVAGHGSFPWNAPEIYADRSPLFRADLIHTPLLLLHGMADVNVPTNESEQLYTALEVLNRPVELVLFPGEDHGISGVWGRRAEHRTMMLEWFDMYLKDQPEAWNDRWGN